MTTTISISTDAPADPATVTEYGDALPELVRALNHVTRHHEAMAYPPDADRLIRNVSQAVSRLPQLLEQVAGWLVREGADGKIEITSGEYQDNPALAVARARLKLDYAIGVATALQEALDSAASVTTDMSGTGDDGTEGQ